MDTPTEPLVQAERVLLAARVLGALASSLLNNLLMDFRNAAALLDTASSSP